MASMNRLNEWWEGISPREQRLVVGLGVTAIVVVLIFIGLQVNKGLAAMDRQNQDARVALDALHTYRLARSVEDVQPKVPIPEEPVKLETYLEETAKEVGITIPSFDNVSPETKGDFHISSTRIELTKVTLAQLANFLETTEVKQKSVVVRELQIKPVFNDTSKLNATLVISSYSKKKSGSPDKKDGKGPQG